MADALPLFRTGLQLQGLRYRFEKAGVVLEDQPIPWSADAVLIEAVVLLPQNAASRTLNDFPLHLGAAALPHLPESVAPQPRGGMRLLYRLPAPRQTTSAEIFYRNRALGQIALPMLSAAEFTRRVQVQPAAVSVCLTGATATGQAFVGSQCHGLIAAAVVRCAQGSLLPLLDVAMSVELSGPRGEVRTVPLHFASAQLAAKETLVSALLPKPRRLGDWHVTWKLGDRVLEQKRIRALSKPQFVRSLRLAATRFVIVDAAGNMTLASSFPSRLERLSRVGPCFMVESAIAGMAGQVRLRVVAKVAGAVQPPLLEETDVIISDGANAVLPGTLSVADLEQVDGFEIYSPRGLLGKLPLRIPHAAIDAEGGFRPAETFSWSDAAEEELRNKLAGLIG